MRWLVVDKFSETIKRLSVPPKEVAVIGGTSKDPEVQLLLSHYPEVKIFYFGIENSSNEENFTYFDLNIFQQHHHEYDLVICSHVLEHLHNLEQSFLNLVKLLDKETGLLWINCPARNFPHGSPEYYSAGYSKEFISKHLDRSGCTIIEAGYFGSERYNFMTQQLHFWSSESEHLHPILGYNLKPGSKLGQVNKMRKDLFWRVISLFFSKKIRTDLDYASEVYVCGRYSVYSS
jgi:hypothetical protein